MTVLRRYGAREVTSSNSGGRSLSCGPLNHSLPQPSLFGLCGLVGKLLQKWTSGDEVSQPFHLFAPPERDHLARDGPLWPARYPPEVASP